MSCLSFALKSRVIPGWEASLNLNAVLNQWDDTIMGYFEMLHPGQTENMSVSPSGDVSFISPDT